MENLIEQDMHKMPEIRKYIVGNIDKALEAGWIDIHYQTIVRGISGNAVSEEALSYWLDPNVGIIMPSLFVPILEEEKLVYKLDLFVLDKVIEKIKMFNQKEIPSVKHSINFSRVDFECCDMAEKVIRKLDENGVGHDKLAIEITEGAIGCNFECLLNQIKRLHSENIEVWLDDFGSGYSALNMLQDIDIDLIKFDRRFLEGIEKNEKAQKILASLVELIKSLDIDIICEGVETKWQLDFVNKIGCEKVQGYYFSLPITLREELKNIEEKKVCTRKKLKCHRFT